MRALVLAVFCLSASAACAPERRAPLRLSRSPAPPAGAATIVFRNRLGAPFEVRRLVVALDGAPQYVHQEMTRAPRSVPLARLRLPPGEHTLSVQTEVAIPLTWFDDATLRARLRSSYSFTQSRRPTRLEVVLDERGGPFVPFVERLRIRYRERVVSRYR